MNAHIAHAAVLDAIGCGVLVTDTDGGIVFGNAAAEEILETKLAAGSDVSIAEIMPLAAKRVFACLETGKPRSARYALEENTELLFDVHPVGKKGAFQGAVCMLYRIPAFEEPAQKLNQQVEAVFASSADGIQLIDADGTIIRVNKASEQLNGVAAREVLGKNVSTFINDGMFDRSVSKEVFRTRRPVSILQYIYKTDKYLLVTGTPVFDAAGDCIMVVVNERDMTELNAIKNQLDQTRMITAKIKDELVSLNIADVKGLEIVAESDEMSEVLNLAFKLAKMEASHILILGESGTGKGLLAKFIHRCSHRYQEPFVQINCAALPETLLEAELFGYEKGAFTGAREQGKAGLLEIAHRGTVFLDEIGDLPLTIQAKLLKYLDDHEVIHLGGLEAKKIDCSVITATHCDLQTLIEGRKFRRDLYYRINSFVVEIPPLRTRPDDILGLSKYYLEKYNDTYGVRRHISAKGIDALLSYTFPGNVRELKSLIKMAVGISDKDDLEETIIRRIRANNRNQSTARGGKAFFPGLPQAMRAHEQDILKLAKKRYKTTREMARYLQVTQPTVVRKMKKHGLS